MVRGRNCAPPNSHTVNLSKLIFEIGKGLCSDGDSFPRRDERPSVTEICPRKLSLSTCEFKSPWSQFFFQEAVESIIFFFFQLLLKISFHFRGGREKLTEEFEECSVSVCSLSSGVHGNREVRWPVRPGESSGGPSRHDSAAIQCPRLPTAPSAFLAGVRGPSASPPRSPPAPHSPVGHLVSRPALCATTSENKGL